MEKKKQIEFRLVSIKTQEFAKFEENFAMDKDININTNLGFGYIAEEKLVDVHVRFVFEDGKMPIMVLGVSCFFQMLQWDEYFNIETKDLLLPKHFAQHIAVITIGTSRGILHSKTEGNIMNSLILPSINVLELVPNDITITPNNL